MIPGFSPRDKAVFSHTKFRLSTRGGEIVEKLAQLGFILARRGRVGLAWTPDGAGEELVRVCAGGVTAAGGRAELFPNLNSPVEGSWAARRWGLPALLFFDTEGPPRLHLFDRLGLPFAPDALGRLKEALSQPATGGAEGGAWTVRCVPPGLWAGETARQLALRGSGPPWRRRQAAVPGDRGADRDLARVLSALGWQVEARWRPGLPAFFAAGGGFRLIAQDETGTPIPPDRLLALVSLIEMENGGGVIALPACRAAGAALAAAGCGGQVLTLERDGERARRLYAARPWLWSAPAAAGRICARMAASGERLSTLAGLVGEGSGG